MIIGALVSYITAIIPMFLENHFCLNMKQLGYFNFRANSCKYNNTFELGILFSVVGVIVTVMLSLSGGRS